MDNSEQEVFRGNAARQILENPLVVAALDDIEAATILKWENANSKDEREDYWRLYKIAKLFRAMFSNHIETGQLALEGIRQKTWLENAKERVFGA
jgi:hypothetical protein